jgi:ribosomal protein S18 acetylase RimI-like enzyme
MEKTLEYAKNKSVKEIWLSVYKDNVPAVKLYQKMKFNIIKENEKSYFMKLEL